MKKCAYSEILEHHLWLSKINLKKSSLWFYIISFLTYNGEKLSADNTWRCGCSSCLKPSWYAIIHRLCFSMHETPRRYGRSGGTWYRRGRALQGAETRLQNNAPLYQSPSAFFWLSRAFFKAKGIFWNKSSSTCLRSILAQKTSHVALIEDKIVELEFISFPKSYPNLLLVKRSKGKLEQDPSSSTVLSSFSNKQTNKHMIIVCTYNINAFLCVILFVWILSKVFGLSKRLFARPAANSCVK